MLSANQVNQYWQDGFLLVRDLLSRQELQPAIESIDRQVADLSKLLHRQGLIDREFDEYDFLKRLAKLEQAYPGASVIIHTSGTLPTTFATLWSSAKLLDIIQQLLGPNIAGHPVWNLRAKTPMTSRATVPWHQDTAYLDEGAEGTFQPTAWIPLVDTNETNGTLQVIRGSHRSKTFPHQLEKKAGKSDSWYLYIDDQNIPAGEIVTCSLNRGDVLLLNQLIVHRSTENYSDSVRWSLDFRWQDPSLPSGFSGKSCIEMRREGVDTYPDWEAWGRESRQTKRTAEGNVVRVDFDLNTDVTGPWLDRWSKSEHEQTRA
jgi:hypothetical protein